MTWTVSDDIDVTSLEGLKQFVENTEGVSCHVKIISGIPCAEVSFNAPAFVTDRIAKAYYAIQTTCGVELICPKFVCGNKLKFDCYVHKRDGFDNAFMAMKAMIPKLTEVVFAKYPLHMRFNPNLVDLDVKMRDASKLLGKYIVNCELMKVILPFPIDQVPDKLNEITQFILENKDYVMLSQDQ